MQAHEPEKEAPGAASPRGVVILGGAHGTLALARSLGKLKVPVCLISSDTPLPSWSRYVRHSLRWPGPVHPEALAFLLQAASQHGLKDFLLVPAGDAEVRFVSQAAEALSASYRTMLPSWEDLRCVCEKPLLYRRAAELGLDFPRTYDFSTLEEAEQADIRFPVVLKPNMGGGADRFSRAKVIRANDRTDFLEAYREAVAQIGLPNVVVQELIAGGGECQFSYAALWRDGQPVLELTARRTRQYPVDFGYTSTFVEAVDEPEVRQAARRILASIGYRGLVEVEFKRDRRDGNLRLLDVNPRPWSWLGLATAAGIDLGAALWSVAAGGRPSSPALPRSNTSWMYLTRDIAAAGRLMLDGKLSLRAYLRSFTTVRAWASFAKSDPLPAVIDLPLTAWRVLTRRLLKIS